MSTLPSKSRYMLAGKPRDVESKLNERPNMSSPLFGSLNLWNLGRIEPHETNHFSGDGYRTTGRNRLATGTSGHRHHRRPRHLATTSSILYVRRMFLKQTKQRKSLFAIISEKQEFPMTEISRVLRDKRSHNGTVR